MKRNPRMGIFLYIVFPALYFWLKRVIIFSVVNTFSCLCRYLSLEKEEVRNMHPSWLLVNTKA